MENQENQRIYNWARNLLIDRALIVWGSGATVPYGLPSMAELNKALGDKVPDFRSENGNLEKELSKKKYNRKMDSIKNAVWECVEEKDTAVMRQIVSGKVDNYIGISKMINAFTSSHPHCLDIVTLNYDRVLEHIMSWHNVPFTDGFNGRVFSSFDENLFQRDTRVHQRSARVNLIKVHGSLNWFDVDGEAYYLSGSLDGASLVPKIIPPAEIKYEYAHSEPFRSLIRMADDNIKKANAFFVVGFGFNDRHITPRLEKEMKAGKPVVLIAENATDSAREKLSQAQSYMILESAGSAEKTKVTYKSKNEKMEENATIEGSYWQLPDFMEIVS